MPLSREDLSLVRGIAFKQHTGSQDPQVIVTPRASDVIVDEAPFPARQLIDKFDLLFIYLKVQKL